MSNLLAKHCNTVIRDMHFADINILLGMGGSKILKFRAVQDYLIKLLTLFPFGTDQYVVKVEAGSSRDTGILYECSVSGNGEGHITGLVAAKVAEELHISSFEPGVFHIEQLFEPLPFIESLASTAGYHALTRWHLPCTPSRNIFYKEQCTIDYGGKNWATPNRFADYSSSKRTTC